MKRLAALALLALPCAAEEGTPAFDPARLVVTTGKLPFVPLNDPKTVPAAEAGFLAGDDFVLGLEAGGEARAYPIRFIAFHHVVNDLLGGRPITVTY